MTAMPKWIGEAMMHMGVTEVKGPKHSETILEYWKAIKRGGIKDDETPWCAAYVGAMLEYSGIRSTRFESARSYLDWGIELKEPAPGCIVVFSRSGGGHVGFVVGVDPAGRLMVLGGNQADAVNIKAFDRNRVVGYRWPAGIPVETWPLPVMAYGEISKNEA